MEIEDAFTFTKPAKILLESDVAGFSFQLVEVQNEFYIWATAVQTENCTCEETNKQKNY